METKKLFGIGSKRVGFIFILVVAAFIAITMTFQEARTSIDIVAVWGSFMGTALLLVGIGKNLENKELQIKNGHAKD